MKKRKTEGSAGIKEKNESIHKHYCLPCTRNTPYIPEISQTRTVWSREAETTRSSEGWKWAHITQWLWPVRTLRTRQHQQNNYNRLNVTNHHNNTPKTRLSVKGEWMPLGQRKYLPSSSPFTYNRQFSCLPLLPCLNSFKTHTAQKHSQANTKTETKTDRQTMNQQDHETDRQRQ